MSLPDFLSRIHDAAGPLLGGLAESELGSRLGESTLVLEIDAGAAEDPGHRAAYLLAANLGARFYPRLAVDAPDDLAGEVTALARRVNPRCEFGPPKGRPLVLSWRGGEPAADRVTVSAEGWKVAVDDQAPASSAAVAPAAMAAAALGVGELFRGLFADYLEHPRAGSEPLAFNLVTFGDPEILPAPPGPVDIGTVYLAGCGAVGQATVATLRELDLTGALYAVDHDSLDPGNLQRYLLSGAADVRTGKTELIYRALAQHGLDVTQIPTSWGASEETAPGRETVLVALDSKQGRIELQAGLPREIFNAWTQPADIGVSRHQLFGKEPCLACLGWPKEARRGRTALIASALGESELRVSSYLLGATPVGQPLAPEQIRPTLRLPRPEEADDWSKRSLLDDLIERRGLRDEQFAGLGTLTVEGLYRDAVCAGMLIEHGEGGPEPELSVPLAHQSALAGILLASALIVDRVPELKERRPQETIARYDVLRGGRQVWSRPRERQAECICQDPDFLAAWQKRWGVPSVA
jgi:hypothetical protein